MGVLCWQVHVHTDAPEHARSLIRAAASDGSWVVLAADDADSLTLALGLAMQYGPASGCVNSLVVSLSPSLPPSLSLPLSLFLSPSLPLSCSPLLSLQLDSAFFGIV